MALRWLAVGRGRAFLVIGLSVIAWGCAAPTATPEPVEPKPRQKAVWNTHPFVARVARLRGLPQRRPTPVSFKETDEFISDMFESAHDRSAKAKVAQMEAWLLAFGLPPLDSDSEKPPKRTNVAGFYDLKSREIVVRRDAELEKEDRYHTPMVLAHEVAHALQDQHFSFPKLAGLTEDARLAALGVVEGDAMVLMLAYRSEEATMSLRRVLASVMRHEKSEDVEIYSHAAGVAPASDATVGLLLERLAFPYDHGLRFVGAIYRTGGFALVNRLYSALPRTTEQLLHPEKYVAGHDAILVPVPELPAGYTPKATGTFGEFLTRRWLAQCGDVDGAAVGAEGWGGDAYAAGAKGEAVGLVWSTAWDSEKDAEQFQLAVEKLRDCAGARYSTLRVARLGSNVALAHRVDDADLDSLTGVTLSPAPAKPPLGRVTLVPVKPAPKKEKPTVVDGEYRDTYLGLRATVPASMSARVRDGSLSLTRKGEKKTQPAVFGAIAHSYRLVTEDSAVELYNDFTLILRDITGNRSNLITSVGPVDTPFGRAFQRSWRVDGTDIEAQRIVIPICGATGSIVVDKIWEKLKDGDALEDWVSSFEWLEKSEPPVCADLDP